MLEQSPRRTALRVAIRRAAHQLFDDPAVLRDHLATRITGPEALRRLQDSATDRGRSRYARAIRAFLAAIA